MATIKKADKLRIIGELVTETSARIAAEMVKAHEEQHPGQSVDAALRELVERRAVSELMFQICNFRCAEEEPEEQDFRNQFAAWFASEEEEKLRNMCRSTIKNELSKLSLPSDENLTFTERYLKKVREEGRNLSTVSLMESLY